MNLQNTVERQLHCFVHFETVNFEASKLNIQNMSSSKQRKDLSLMEKIRLIRTSEKKEKSQRQLSTEFGVSLGTVHNTLKRKAEYEALYLETVNVSAPVRVRRHTVHENVNVLVWEWYTQAKTRGHVINSPMLQSHARHLALEIDPTTTFRASNGWLQSFIKRYEITFPRSKINTDNSSDLLWYTEKDLKVLVQEYALENIYVLFDIGLFSTALPSHTLPTNIITSYQQYSVLCCCNAMGEQEPVVVCGTSACIVVPDGMQWMEQDTPWFTVDKITTWLTALNKKMEERNKMILLLVPDVPYLPLQVTWSHMTLRRIIPALENDVQEVPFYHTLQLRWKTRYRIYFLRHVVARCSRLTQMEDVYETITLQHTINMMLASWKDISPEHIQTAFALTDIQEDSMISLRHDEEMLQKLISACCPLLLSESLMTAQEYIEVDARLATYATEIQDTEWERVLVEQHQQALYEDTSDPVLQSLVSVADAETALEHINALYLFASTQDSTFMSALSQLSMSLDALLAKEQIEQLDKNTI